MSKIASLAKIGESLGVTKQLVSRDFVAPGFLKKNENGKIDIEDKENRAFLKSKGANFDIFYPAGCRTTSGARHLGRFHSSPETGRRARYQRGCSPACDNRGKGSGYHNRSREKFFEYPGCKISVSVKICR